MFASIPHPRELLQLGPHNQSHWPALRVVVSVMTPLVVLTVLGRVDLALFAVFGAFASIYGRGGSHRARLHTQALAGTGMLVSIGLGAAVSTTGAARPWLSVVVGPLIAAVGSLTSDTLRWRPPGSVFLVFSFGAISSVPGPQGGGAGRQVLLALGVAGASMVFSLLVGALGAVDRRRRRGTPPAAFSVRATLGRRGVWTHASRYFLAALVAGSIATAAGLGHPYWAMLTAVVPMAAADTRARLLRAGHRLLGTGLGLLVAAGLLALHPSGWLLILLVGAAQFGAELFVLRNYSLALLFITPLALLMTTLSGTPDPAQLLSDRGLETLLGVLIGVGATLLWSERERSDLQAEPDA
jgi:hypothetical protein